MKGGVNMDKHSEENIMAEVRESALLETFDEAIEGYGNCGNTSKKYKCKKDCIFLHNAVISAVD